MAFPMFIHSFLIGLIMVGEYVPYALGRLCILKEKTA